MPSGVGTGAARIAPPSGRRQAIFPASVSSRSITPVSVPAYRVSPSSASGATTLSVLVLQIGCPSRSRSAYSFASGAASVATYTRSDSRSGPPCTVPATRVPF